MRARRSRLAARRQGGFVRWLLRGRSGGIEVGERAEDAAGLVADDGVGGVGGRDCTKWALASGGIARGREFLASSRVAAGVGTQVRKGRTWGTRLGGWICGWD